MNSFKRLQTHSILLALTGCILLALDLGCGVKGKPLPPLQPAEIGRGAPTYRRAAEQAKPERVQGAEQPSPTPAPPRNGP